MSLQHGKMLKGIHIGRFRPERMVGLVHLLIYVSGLRQGSRHDEHQPKGGGEGGGGSETVRHALPRHPPPSSHPCFFLCILSAHTKQSCQNE